MEPVGLFINLGVPAVVLALYWWIWRRLDVEDPDPVVVFLLFFHYGAWLIVFLTMAFWYWSGMATLGVMYLTTAGTMVMLVLAVMTFRERKRSFYHSLAFVASVFYFIPVGLTYLLIFWLLFIGVGGGGMA
jgi:hypothetical protein